MDEKIDIELIDDEKKEKTAIQLPLNFLTFGEIENDDLKVYIKQDVFKELEKYSKADVEHERGTILIGEYSEELGKTHVVISDYIEAKYTDASASTLTFTHETWDYIHKEQDAKYPDKTIVGWQHTHPGYGIFLSNYDLFIHENFFNLPFQVAYVIDPVQNFRGFFQWKNGKIEKLKGYYVYDDIGKPIKIENEKAKVDNTGGSGKKSTAALTAGLVLAVVLAALGLFLATKTSRELESVKNTAAQTQQALQEGNTQETSIDNMNSMIQQQQDTIDSQQQLIDKQQQELNELHQQIESLENGVPFDVDDYVFYRVNEWDRLGAICTQLGIDYEKNRELILALNKIEDEDLIYAGQVLLFPKSMQKWV